MARYAIGDVHGNVEALDRLLRAIAYRPDRDRLLFVGDLVNRGPASAATLARVRSHCESEGASAVLGNHDLHLMGCILGVRAPRASDTLSEILGSPAERHRALEWLRTLPLLLEESDLLVVHAGILPVWKEASLRVRACAIATAMQESDGALATFVDAAMPLPQRAEEAQSDLQRMAFDLAVLTRVRALLDPHTPDWRYKRTLEAMPDAVHPWFAHPDAPLALSKPILFGHWAALGLHEHGLARCIDSGCAWGRTLSAWNIDRAELTSVEAPAH